MDFLDIFRSIGALSLTLGLLLGAAYLIRKYGLMNGQSIGNGIKKRLKINDQLWLDAGRSRILIIECDGQEQVILVSPNGAQNLNIKTTPEQSIATKSTGV